MTGKKGSSPESIVREIKRQTRRKFTAEEKIRIVLEGLRDGGRGPRLAFLPAEGGNAGLAQA